MLLNKKKPNHGLLLSLKYDSSRYTANEGLDRYR